MAEFETSYQDPFVRGVREATVDAGRALADFDGIDWARLNRDIFRRHDDVEEDYYFWEVRQPGARDAAHALNVSGEYVPEEVAARSGERFTLRYLVPRVATSRGFLGFGAGRIKASQDEVVMEACDLAFARECVAAFLAGDHAALGERIVQRESDPF